ncbi:hypothetical protein ABBQ38_009101 [Trebouxia sp. C0009 RCD-2024]
MRKTSRWKNLSVELWVHILSHLYTDLTPVGPEVEWGPLVVERRARQLNNMQTLRLVCRSFNTALSDAQFSRCLFLPEKFSNKSIPSLLQWLLRYRTAVQLFAVASGTPTMEAALAALTGHASQLLFTYVANISAGAVHILSCHSGLQTIEIESTADETNLDLTPLAALPCLSNLGLKTGQFSCEEALLHLTILRLSDAEMLFAKACFSGSKLLELNLCGSLLYGCDQGLSGCHNLTDLRLKQCWFGANRAEDKLDLLPFKVAHVPASISSLTQLTSLDITLCGQSLLAMQFSWLASLTSLQELVFHGAGANVKLPSDLTELTRLETLWLTMGDEPADSMTYMDFQVNWREMRALTTLSVDAGMYAFDSKLLQVVECGTLNEVFVTGIRPYSAESAKFFAVLISRLATKRPDVLCFLDHVDVSEID